jgi:uncharacterized protein (DUF58 family)
MSRAVAQSLGRIVLVAFVLLALLALLTTARVASTRDRRGRRSLESVERPLTPVKGDVRRRENGSLEYYDGRQWTSTPPPPRDDAF